MTPLTDKLRALLAERDAESIYNERMSIMNALADLIAASLAEIEQGERARVVGDKQARALMAVIAQMHRGSAETKLWARRVQDAVEDACED